MVSSHRPQYRWWRLNDPQMCRCRPQVGYHRYHSSHVSERMATLKTVLDLKPQLKSPEPKKVSNYYSFIIRNSRLICVDALPWGICCVPKVGVGYERFPGQRKAVAYFWYVFTYGHLRKISCSSPLQGQATAFILSGYICLKLEVFGGLVGWRVVQGTKNSCPVVPSHTECDCLSEVVSLLWPCGVNLSTKADYKLDKCNMLDLSLPILMMVVLRLASATF